MPREAPHWDQDDDAAASPVDGAGRPPSTKSPLPPRITALPNLLDGDGVAVFIEDFLAQSDADALFAELMEHLAWERHTVRVYGKDHEMPRDTAWYGDAAYRYSGATHPPAPWPDPLATLRQALCDALDTDFNTVLGNRYETVTGSP